jgi:metallophosphoesterase (TIGR00282 family)
MKILFIGDVVGDPGRLILQKNVVSLREEFKIDVVIVNGENSANDGRGITPAIADSFFALGVHVITTGNHVWAKKEILDYIPRTKNLLRPANFPGECPGSGVTVVTLPDGKKLGVINIMGRVFMREHLACPFRTAEGAVMFLRNHTPFIIVDMHAETTAEKIGLGHFLDGKISALVGTHTHVPTADERILPGGTAFITDVGMCGAINSMIGMKKGPIIDHFLTQMPTRFAVETEGPIHLCGVVIELDPTSGFAKSIKRVVRTFLQ